LKITVTQRNLASWSKPIRQRLQEELIYFISQNILGRWKENERWKGKGGKYNLTRQGQLFYGCHQYDFGNV
jgi:hypothetical protein